MTYVKDNGDISIREVIVISEPRDNYLMLDVSKLSNNEVNLLLEAYKVIDKYRDDALGEFERVTGIKQNSLWRSFKPEGVEWNKEDEH
jgi:hypothetical protein